MNDDGVFAFARFDDDPLFVRVDCVVAISVDTEGFTHLHMSNGDDLVTDFQAEDVLRKLIDALNAVNNL